jgi:hypothetical protein
MKPLERDKMPTVSEMFPDFPTRAETLAHYVGKARAVECLLAGRLSEEDFKEYLAAFELREAGTYVDDHVNEEAEKIEADERTSVSLECLSMSPDFDAIQFSLNDLRAVERLVLEYAFEQMRILTSELRKINESNASAKEKATRYDRFVRHKDPKRERLFRLATEIYAQKRRVKYVDALTEANKANGIYPDDEFDNCFGEIDAHYRQWRSRNKNVVAAIIGRLKEQARDERSVG